MTKKILLDNIIYRENKQGGACMSHFSDKEFKKKRAYVEKYYTEHNDGITYFEKALYTSDSSFRVWIFTEYDRLNLLGERHKLCENGHKCNCENCLECPFEPNEPNDYDHGDLGMETAKLISKMNGETL